MKNYHAATTLHGLIAVLLCVVLLLCCISLIACQQPVDDAVTTIHGQTMGTTYSVKVVDLAHVSNSELSKGIKHKLDVIEQLMSTWRPDSELSKFNQAPTGKWITLSFDTIYVLDLALSICRQSQGSFDITIAPLVNLWGFGARLDQANINIDAVPVDKEIVSAMLQVGCQYLLVDKNNQRAKKQADVIIDVSAIAKGYAVDKISAYLDSLGLNDYLIEVGGELRLKGSKPGDRNWTIAIESPLFDMRRAHYTLVPGNAAVATSGDYRNYFEINGQRYSHTIDPTTCKPVTHTLASVTVVDKTAARADAYATTLMVMGPDSGYQFALKNGLAAYFIFRQENRFSELQTPQFSTLINHQKD